MQKKVLLLTLETFSGTGGIQRMTRTFAHALHLICLKNNWALDLFALNDKQTDLISQYLPSINFKGFDKNKAAFAFSTIMSGRHADLVVLSHINLSCMGILIHLLHPKCKIWLFAHGLEVWHPASIWKRPIWNIAERILCVSRFTRSKILAVQGANPNRCVVLNNALDPFIELPTSFIKPEYLSERYRLKENDRVILTLTRIAAAEQLKGYEQIISAIYRIKQTIPNIKYILAGPYTDTERQRIQQMIKNKNLDENFILTGYIEERELADHFLLADLFVLTSQKEGFGLVFIEAMAFGLPVICGNKDGSTDAVRNEKMGATVDPSDANALEKLILLKLNQPLTIDERKAIQQECLKYFNLDNYLVVLEGLIDGD